MLDLARAYQANLRLFLTGGGELALSAAYDHGRAAMAQSIGVTEMIHLHHYAMEALLLAEPRLTKNAKWLELAAAFLGEALGPFEMTQRGYLEALERQRVLNADLGIANELLAQKNQELKAASLHKSEFLANMSHELRTPLNAIIGFSEILKDGLIGDLNSKQHELMGDIFNSGQHLLSLINDILDLSKVEAGKMDLDLETVDVLDLMQKSLAVVKEKAAGRRIRLDQELPPALPPFLADRRKILQILYNLLSNAVKFTPENGRVILRAKVVPAADLENWSTTKLVTVKLPIQKPEFAEFIEISVEDSGIGINPEEMARLFLPFSQLGSSLMHKSEGTGLGLAMVLKLAQLHGGVAAATSTPQQGSCFIVWLPWRRPV
jgi:signal transduction histidine kinase